MWLVRADVERVALYSAPKSERDNSTHTEPMLNNTTLISRCQGKGVKRTSAYRDFSLEELKGSETSSDTESEWEKSTHNRWWITWPFPPDVKFRAFTSTVSALKRTRQMGVRWQCHIIGTVMFKSFFKIVHNNSHSSNVNNFECFGELTKLNNSFAMFPGMIILFHSCVPKRLQYGFF